MTTIQKVCFNSSPADPGRGTSRCRSTKHTNTQNPTVHRGQPARTDTPPLRGERLTVLRMIAFHAWPLNHRRRRCAVTGMGQRLRYDGSPGPLLRRTPAHTTRRCRISWTKKCLLARAAQTRPSASTRALLPSLTADQAARLGSRTRITEAPLLAPVAVITALFPHLSLSLSQKQHTHSTL